MAELFTLSNGLTVLLEENHAAPVISFHMLVKVGSAVEKKNEAGICHVIEHMLFKGTPTRPVGAIAQDVEAAGGEINAYTSFDQTVFYINMASRFAKEGLSILSDAVQNPIFDENELEREKEVILEEIRRDKDNPSHRCSELLFMKAYKQHPYKNPIIGNEETVKSFTQKQILQFYRRWYTPDNLSLIVVGKFDSKKMLKLVEELNKDFTGSNTPKMRLAKEPAPQKFAAYYEDNPIQATYFTFGFHIPEISHDDVPAIDVLSHILAGSESSRLPQEIREKKQLVNAVYAYAFTPKDPGLFFIGGLATPDKTEKALIAIIAEIHKLHTYPISTGELSRAKLMLRSNEIYEKETTSGQASKYAYFMATAGTHTFEKKYYQAIQDIRADDIRRVAQKYFTPENATLIVVNPKGDEKKINRERIKKAVKKLKPSRTSIMKTEKHVSPPILHKLSSGVRLIIREDHTLPIVSCCTATLGGLRFENKQNNGINNLLAQMITKGTKKNTAVEIAEKIESIAGSIEGYNGRNSFGVRAEFLSDKLGEGFDLLAEVLTEPSFSASEIKNEKYQILDAIKNQEDALTTMAFIKFLAHLFPTHPYGLRALGEAKTVRSLNRQMLIDYYNRLMTPENMVISIVGDVAPKEVIAMAEDKIMYAWKKGRKFQEPKPEKPNKKAINVEHRRPEKEQAHIVMGFLGPKITSNDHYVLAVLNNILSGQGGKLFLKLRDQMSLAYSVNSTFFVGLEPGYIALYIGTEPSKIDTAITGMRGELRQVVEKGVTQEELSRARNHLIGSYELEKQRNLSLAGSYAFNILYGLGLKEVEEYPMHIQRVSRQDIQRIAQKYLKLDAPVTAIIRPT